MHLLGQPNTFLAPAAVQKTYTTTDTMIGAETHQHGAPILLSGVLMNGRTKCSHLEYWVRGPFAEGGAPALNDDDPELLAAPWVRFELPPPPASLDGALPGGTAAGSEVFAVGRDGVPEQWPLPFGYSSWSVEVGGGLARGRYEIRARAVDIAGNAQVRKTPSWPRSWANFSLLPLYSHRNAWANLHLLGQPNTFLAAEPVRGRRRRRADLRVGASRGR